MDKPPVITHPWVVEWVNDQGAKSPDATLIGRLRFDFDEWH